MLYEMPYIKQTYLKDFKLKWIFFKLRRIPKAQKMWSRKHFTLKKYGISPERVNNSVHIIQSGTSYNTILEIGTSFGTRLQNKHLYQHHFQKNKKTHQNTNSSPWQLSLTHLKISVFFTIDTYLFVHSKRDPMGIEKSLIMKFSSSAEWQWSFYNLPITWKSISICIEQVSNHSGRCTSVFDVWQ